jgi:O-antigen ligase
LVDDSGYAQFINYNHFAYLMEMALGVILGLVLGGGVRREQALIYVGALIPIWIGLVLCGSRGGLIAMLAQLVIAAVLFSMVAGKSGSRESAPAILRVLNSRSVRVCLVCVLIVGVILGTVWLGGDQLASKIEGLRAEFELDDSRLGVSRNEMWRASWQMFATHPVAGAGMGGYAVAIPRFHDAAGTMTPQEAHNDYLELLASGGLIGLALAVWFAVVVCKRTLANLRAPNRFRRAACYGAAIGIAGVAVHSLVDFGLHMLVNALVFTTLIVIATSKPHWGDQPARNL